jgi:hypothetical protein
VVRRKRSGGLLGPGKLDRRNDKRTAAEAWFREKGLQLIEHPKEGFCVRVSAGKNPIHSRQTIPRSQLEDSCDQFLLRTEVPIEGGFGDVGCLDYVINSSVMDAIIVDQASGRLYESLPRAPSKTMFFHMLQYNLPVSNVQDMCFPNKGQSMADKRYEPDGRTDFDFLIGSWTVHNRRLKARLKGCTEWEEFESTCRARHILGGLGNMDEYTMERASGRIEAVTVAQRVGLPADYVASLQ